MKAPKLTPAEQIAFMRELEGQYLDQMEGADSKEFVYWSDLAMFANAIAEAMEKEQAEN